MLPIPCPEQPQPLLHHTFSRLMTTLFHCPHLKNIFVHLTIQGLYLSQCAHPDIQTVISFLCSCIRDPDQDDYKKPTHLIQYLHATWGLTGAMVRDRSNGGLMLHMLFMWI